MDFKLAEKTTERFLKRKATDDEAAPCVRFLFDHWQAHPRPADKEHRSYAQHLVGEVQRYVHNNEGAYPATEGVIAEVENVIRAQREQAPAAAEAARVERVAANRAEFASRIIMSTTPTIANREIREVVGVISGSCVMSRNMWSDANSNISSAFGGRLGGIELAVRNAQIAAEEHIQEAARELGADAVVGIVMSVQTVADKAQLVILMGTAVELA